VTLPLSVPAEGTAHAERDRKRDGPEHKLAAGALRLDRFTFLDQLV
jgi:hypothetical protein